MPVLDQQELEQLQQTVARVLGALQQSSRIENGALLVYVAPENNTAALHKLRDETETALDILSCISAVDYFPRDPRFELVYELFSTVHQHRARVKVQLADTGTQDVLPEVESAHDVYLTAIWHERECFDLMGINFKHHPDLRRILLPDGWDGYPLRKEEPFDGKDSWRVGCNVEAGVQADSHLGLEVGD